MYLGIDVEKYITSFQRTCIIGVDEFVSELELCDKYGCKIDTNLLDPNLILEYYSKSPIHWKRFECMFVCTQRGYEEVPYFQVGDMKCPDIFLNHFETFSQIGTKLTDVHRISGNQHYFYNDSSVEEFCVVQYPDHQQQYISQGGLYKSAACVDAQNKKILRVSSCVPLYRWRILEAYYNGYDVTNIKRGGILSFFECTCEDKNHFLESVLGCCYKKIDQVKMNKSFTFNLLENPISNIHTDAVIEFPLLEIKDINQLNNSLYRVAFFYEDPCLYYILRKLYFDCVTITATTIQVYCHSLQAKVGDWVTMRVYKNNILSIK
jgi:hypothetical protein